MPVPPRASVFAPIAATLGWFSLLLQFWATVNTARENGLPLFTGIVNYFSYFTILTNVLAALLFTFYKRGFFARAGVQTAIAVYMAVVGLTYSLLLRQLWNPQGLQKIADVLLHDAMPLVALLWWFLYVRMRSLRSPATPPASWLAYPLAYFLYSMARGAVAGWYPYPFLDAGALGYPRVLLNAAAMLLGFLLLSALAIACTPRHTGTPIAP